MVPAEPWNEVDAAAAEADGPRVAAAVVEAAEAVARPTEPAPEMDTVTAVEDASVRFCEASVDENCSTVI